MSYQARGEVGLHDARPLDVPIELAHPRLQLARQLAHLHARAPSGSLALPRGREGLGLERGLEVEEELAERDAVERGVHAVHPVAPPRVPRLLHRRPRDLLLEVCRSARAASLIGHAAQAKGGGEAEAVAAHLSAACAPHRE